MKKPFYIIFALLILAAQGTLAQNSTVRHETRQGNREYKKNQFERAEVNYRRALESDSTAYRAHHNLGNTLYRKKNYAEAAQHFSEALREPSLDSKTRSNILHNKGNSHLQSGLQKADRAQGMEDFKQAVADYQEALKLNPKSDNTRYNLSYAMKMLQQAQQQQQQQNGGGDNQQDKNDKGQNNQDQQNQNQQNKDQNQQGDDQKQQNQQGQQGQQQQDSQQNPKDQKGQSPQQKQKMQDAERMLEAVKNNEKNTLKEHARKLETGTPQRIEKDW